ncbi:MAG: plasmid mobilization protein, partial [Geminicoccaceae bacterium]
MAENRITTRFDEETDDRIAAAAERCDLAKAEWLRNAALTALAMETSTSRDLLSFVDLSNQVRDLHTNLGQIATISNKIKQGIGDLSRTIAIERAADRFMNEQILRIAVRAAHAAMTVASNRGFDDKEDVFKLLCD